MRGDELLISILSLLIVAVFIFKPLLAKKLIKTTGNEQPPREDPTYDSVDSYAERILGSDDQKKQYRIIEPEIIFPRKGKRERDTSSVFNKINRQSDLKKAMIWKEILIGWP